MSSSGRRLAVVYPQSAAFMQRIKADLSGAGLAVVGDSTTTTWLTALTAWLATQAPNRTVTQRTWSDALQCYSPPATVQVGTAGDRYVDNSALSVTVTVPDSVATSITGDLDVQAKVAMQTWNSGGPLAIASKNGGAGQRSWWIDLSGTSLTLTISADGITFVTKTSTAGVPFSAGQAGWIRATLDVDNGAAGYDVKFYTSNDGLAWTQLGATVTTAGITTLFDTNQSTQLIGRGGGSIADATKAYALRVLNGINGVPVVDIDLDALPASGNTFTDYAGNTVTVNGVFTVAGALGLAVFDGSLAGSSISYATDVTRFAKLTPYPADLASINYGHTGGTTTSAYRADFKTIADAYVAKWPDTFVIGNAQNPQTAPRTQDQIYAHALRAETIRQFVDAQGYGLVDAYKAFADDGRAIVGTLVSGDGVHPTAAGYDIWLATAKSALGTS